ncbi:MAG: FAD binding domain-containing protein [Tissierellaceae bacterium]
MIAFDFEYYKPDTVEEAFKLYKQLNLGGKKPIYYGGGTEFISMARMNNRYAGAVIDIKAIEECNVNKIVGGELIMGSALSLSKIAESNLFPLMAYIARRIADHTIQGKITLGGNLLGTIIYKEACLALLLSNSKLVIYGRDGKRTVPILDMYDQGLRLEEGELLLQIIVDERITGLPFRHVKRTKLEKIDYPLITMAAIKDGDNISLAFSGLYQYPNRSLEMEKIINDSSMPEKKKVERAIEILPEGILDDLGASSQFRKFILNELLSQVFDKFEEVC